MQAIILCDFDGTTALQDVCDEVLNKFGHTDWAKFGQAYDAGEISHKEMNHLFVEQLRCTPEELSAFLKSEIVIRKGFEEFYSFVRLNDIGIILLSGGWDFCIRTVMQNFKVSFPDDIKALDNELANRQNLPTICNGIDMNNGSYNLLPHPYESQKCTPDKAKIAQELKSQYGVPIICIGDGSTDYDITQIADITFATGSLSKHCEKNGLRFIPFTTFHEIKEALEKLLSANFEITKVYQNQPITFNLEQ